MMATPITMMDVHPHVLLKAIGVDHLEVLVAQVPVRIFVVMEES